MKSTTTKKPYNKLVEASKHPKSLGFATKGNFYSIEYSRIPPSNRGMTLTIGSIGACIFASLGLYGLSFSLFNFLGYLDLVFIWVAALYLLLWSARLELFRPISEPIVFNRHRKVIHRIFMEKRSGATSLLRSWPMRFREYDWNLIDAQHNAAIATTGSTVYRRHSLVFTVRRSADDPTIIDAFTIGNPMILSEETVPAVWEHIRRFMEENGPPLPPGESWPSPEIPKTLWESMGAVGPIGPNYLKWWREEDGFMMLVHVLFFFFVPMYLVWGFFNWLSFKTAREIEWPQEILDAMNPDKP